MGKIVWLASYPKSGNTWLRVFLHNLFRDPAEPYDINQIDKFSVSDSAAGWYQQLDPRPVTEMTDEEIAQLRPRVHKAITGIFPDNVFVKTHSALVMSHGTPAITMEQTAGAIYIVRNPLDVVISYAHHYGRTLDEAILEVNRPGLQTQTGERHVYELLGSWTEHVASWTSRPNPALHVMRYEDMLAEPERAFGAVTNFLGLTVRRERLLKAIEQSSFRNMREQESQKGFAERSDKSDRFFREGRAEQWREVMTQEQVDAIVAAHRQQMSRFGYFPLPKRN
ncbi:MAG TPA: sulfotransferase domain-containing protein [Hypericibacter adhaerens]|jgi:hypothetical protein|uniref:Sulfotransferase n=1 Tax=Hypericibacter adhaerens TaxID=2602016 RepID=A0A5J6N4X9_9PROT|nr:sulfotransferase domain-containing protein [Hypericibacter adhaerens]QEX25122.1 sulfotransferase [Hypericibacter adhaerens]HWA45723.1 sulfotransferase domain-containing protein [Hypericibacter adhaerens]